MQTPHPTRRRHITHGARLARLAHLALLATLASATAAAQTPTDGAWRGSGGAALSLTSGNTSSSSLQLSAEATRATARDKTSLTASANQARDKTNGLRKTTASKWSLTGQYDRNLSPRQFLFGKLSLESDRLVQLDLRSALAVGIGHKLVDRPGRTVELFGGAGYTSDRYGTVKTIGGRTASRFSRSSLYLAEASSHQLTPTVALKQRLELYPGLGGDKTLLAKLTASLTVALNNTLSLNVGLTSNFNSKPPAGARKNDLGLFTGLNLRFGAR